LLDWYDAHRREMPWRGHPDPYAVWVSEIMLQQTQVETVRGYFARFLAAFPSVGALASAPQQAVLKAWEGLGYYSRARNLQKAAQAVTAAGDALPTAAAAWAALPGVGAYTAAAIASICFGEPAPVVDGNVARVFARFLCRPDDFRKPAARAALAAWLQPHIEDSRRPGDFNQAVMDLGATVCTPRAPACESCPLAEGCAARRAGRQTDFPVKPPKRTPPLRAYAAALVRDADGRVLFVQRPADGLLGGLWELPNLPVQGEPAPRDALRALRLQTGLSARRAARLGTVKHAFTHFTQLLHVFALNPALAPEALARTPHPPQAPAAFADPDELPLTTAARRALALTNT
jgi:A/G-specific adenine glycosylase